MDDARDRDREWQFGEVLSELKDRGCAALVTGHAPAETYEEIGTNFLGGPGARRARVLATVEGDAKAARSRLRHAGPGHEPAIVVDTLPDVARAVAARQVSIGDRAVTVRRSDYSLSAVESEVVDAVHDVRQLHGPFEPAELRVGVDSLRPLAERYDAEDLYEFVRAVADAVVDVDGMAHFAFPGDRDDPVVQSLVPAFDVLVEVRDENECVEQRWTFRDYDAPSPWVPV